MEEFNILSWSCPQCTFINNSLIYCVVCGYENSEYQYDIPHNINIKKEKYKKNLKTKFYETFKKQHVFTPVIHCKDYEQVKKNCDMCFKHCIDGVWLINHDISSNELINIIKKLRFIYPNKWIGINLPDEYSFNILKKIYDNNLDINGIWCDKSYIDETNTVQNIPELMLSSRFKNNWDGLYFGGVAFKYQIQPSNLEENVKLASLYMDVITTSDKNGGETSIKKIHTIKSNANNTPIAVASGITFKNYENYKNLVNCFMINSSISEDFYNLSEEKLIRMNENINSLN